MTLLQTLLNRHMTLSNVIVDFHLNWRIRYFTIRFDLLFIKSNIFLFICITVGQKKKKKHKYTVRKRRYTRLEKKNEDHLLLMEEKKGYILTYDKSDKVRKNIGIEKKRWSLKYDFLLFENNYITLYITQIYTVKLSSTI